MTLLRRHNVLQLIHFLFSDQNDKISGMNYLNSHPCQAHLFTCVTVMRVYTYLLCIVIVTLYSIVIHLTSLLSLSFIVTCHSVQFSRSSLCNLFDWFVPVLLVVSSCCPACMFLNCLKQCCIPFGVF